MKFKVGDRVKVDNIAGSSDVGDWAGTYTIESINEYHIWPIRVVHPKLSVGSFEESELKLASKYKVGDVVLANANGYEETITLDRESTSWTEPAFYAHKEGMPEESAGIYLESEIIGIVKRTDATGGTYAEGYTDGLEAGKDLLRLELKQLLDLVSLVFVIWLLRRRSLCVVEEVRDTLAGANPV